METETRTHDTIVSTDEKHAIKWLEKEYPRGIDLYYVDYRESLDEHPDIIMELVRDGYSEKLDEWTMDYEMHYLFDDVFSTYLNTLDEIEELDDQVMDAMRDWMYDHDTSTFTADLLRNTGKQLLFIDTGVEAYENSENVRELVRRFGKNDKQKAEIEFITREQMYHSTIQFYFHVDIDDVRNALHKDDGEYITIDGAMIGNVTRGNGSNWLGDEDIFKIVMTKKNFIANVYGDAEAGTGYGWGSICGDWNRDGAVVNSSKTKKRGYQFIAGETDDDNKSEQALLVEQEREYIKRWDNGRGECTRGDMNYNRHGSKTYINEYPCGTHCDKCGNFWID